MENNRRRWDAILDRIPEGRPFVGAEIGVLMANTAMRILAARPLLTHYMIDPWSVPDAGSSYAESGDDSATKGQDEHEKAYQTTVRRVSGYGERAVIMRMTSATAAPRFEDESLDYVFIDADHSFDGVYDDIRLWLPKLKRGGWIGGHDFEHPRFPGVAEAVRSIFIDEVIETDANRTWFVMDID